MCVQIGGAEGRESESVCAVVIVWFSVFVWFCSFVVAIEVI